MSDRRPDGPPSDGSRTGAGSGSPDDSDESDGRGEFAYSTATDDRSDSGSRGDPAPEDGADDDTPSLVRDVVTVVGIVGVLALLLFGASGVWPPFVAIESGSMEPNAGVGDLVFIVEPDRFADERAIDGTGVVTLEDGQNGGYEELGRPGDVVVFWPDGDRTETPIIHRAYYWADEGENWVETAASEDNLAGRDCTDIASCPAPHDGFVTKGDANPAYDQAVDNQYADTSVVAPEWVIGKSAFRIPWLGYVRLAAESLFASIGVAAFGVGLAFRERSTGGW
ncbi:S24/S26 family peptidase [Halobiforma nitratireducens]|uniref:Peptidase S26B, signal peptidase n=1 Tax=Halobiforma nitratireducens JCM 10879 TaxID=1227454 RepID=M0M8J5_9EURY|nr:S26 family signal peptidase [Halobiforma nitratireducens]EMA40929.1 peptidase S26B, signal peptidase [Halobiforma nitratireducens JCM 10879]